MKLAALFMVLMLSLPFQAGNDTVKFYHEWEYASDNDTLAGNVYLVQGEYEKIRVPEGYSSMDVVISNLNGQNEPFDVIFMDSTDLRDYEAGRAFAYYPDLSRMYVSEANYHLDFEGLESGGVYYLVIDYTKRFTEPESADVHLNYTMKFYRTYSIALNIDEKSFNYYRSVPLDERYVYSRLFTTSDSAVEELAAKIGAIAATRNFTLQDTVGLSLSFVQTLGYIDDEVYGHPDYPKFPVETLVDHGGDCEDLALLLAALLYDMGVDVILLNPPEHMATGVWFEGLNVSGGYYVEYHGKKYYYCETTSTGWSIGELPDGMSSTMSVITLDAGLQKTYTGGLFSMDIFLVSTIVLAVVVVVLAVMYVLRRRCGPGGF